MNDNHCSQPNGILIISRTSRDGAKKKRFNKELVMALGRESVLNTMEKEDGGDGSTMAKEKKV